MIEWANRAFTELTGYTLEEAHGKTPALLRSGRHDNAFYDELWSTVSRGQTWQGELENRRKDGSLYWERMVIAPVLSPSRSILHYIAIKRDISAERSMEEQLNRAQRLESIGLMAGSIAHDLNNVLAPIMMGLELFGMRFTDAADRRRIETMSQAATRGAGIVRQILTFARGVDGEQTRLEPNRITKEVARFLRESLPPRITLQTELAEKCPNVIGDVTQLHQVLINLAVNARDAMPDAGTLTVRTAAIDLPHGKITFSGAQLPPGGYITFEVSDDGVGITPAVQARMLEPFFTTKPRGQGTGLGLSTVHGILRGHRGGLDMETSLGVGTTFTAYLPVAPPSGSEAPFAGPAESVLGGGRTVLVVDDEEPVRSVLTLAFQSLHFEVQAAVDGEEAIRLFNATPDRYCAVVLDFMMPHVGGDQVGAHLKRIRPQLPVILSSGALSGEAATLEAAARYRACGDVLLRKPFSRGELIHALLQVLPPPQTD